MKRVISTVYKQNVPLTLEELQQRFIDISGYVMFFKEHKKFTVTIMEIDINNLPSNLTTESQRIANVTTDNTTTLSYAYVNIPEHTHYIIERSPNITNYDIQSRRATYIDEFLSIVSQYLPAISAIELRKLENKVFSEKTTIAISSNSSTGYHIMTTLYIDINYLHDYIIKNT